MTLPGPGDPTTQTLRPRPVLPRAGRGDGSFCLLFSRVRGEEEGMLLVFGIAQCRALPFLCCRSQALRPRF